MFLKSLNSREKDHFLKLAMAIMKADGVIGESKKLMLSDYANEMKITSFNLEERCETDKIIEEFVMTSTPKTKRIVFLELLALAFADGNYSTEEKTLVQQLANAFKLEKTFIERAKNLQDAYLTVYTSLVNLIEKGE